MKTAMITGVTGQDGAYLAELLLAIGLRRARHQAPRVVANLARLVASTVDYEGKLLFDHSKPDGTPRKLLDSSEIRSMGWQPSISMRRGLRETYDWYVSSMNDKFAS